MLHRSTESTTAFYFVNNNIMSVSVHVCVWVSSSICLAAWVMRGWSGTGTTCWANRHKIATLPVGPGWDTNTQACLKVDTHKYFPTPRLPSRPGELSLKQAELWQSKRKNRFPQTLGCESRLLATSYEYLFIKTKGNNCCGIYYNTK